MAISSLYALCLSCTQLCTCNAKGDRWLLAHCMHCVCMYSAMHMFIALGHGIQVHLSAGVQ